MSHCLRALFFAVHALIVVPFDVAADLPPPPATSALKATHVTYGKTLYALATQEISSLQAQLATAIDIRTDVLARLQAIELKFTAAPANGKIALSWRGHPADGIELEISENGASFGPLAVLAAGTQQYVATGLRPGRPYWFRAIATLGANRSPPSNVATCLAGAPAPL